MDPRDVGLGDDGLQRSITATVANSRFGVLATSGDGSPHLSLVAIAFAYDLHAIVFATERTTRKFANLQANASAAVLVDNRESVLNDLSAGVAVTATGIAEVTIGDERRRLGRLLRERHPYMADFLSLETCAIVKLGIDGFHQARGLSQVGSLTVERE